MSETGIDRRQRCQRVLRATGKQCGTWQPAYYMRTVTVAEYDKKRRKIVRHQELWCEDCAIDDPPSDPTRLMNPDELRKYKEELAVAVIEDKVPPGVAIRPPARFGPSPLANFVDAMWSRPNQAAVAKFRGEERTSDKEMHMNKIKVKPLCVECGRNPRVAADEKYCSGCKKAMKLRMKHANYFQRVPMGGRFRDRDSREATRETKFGTDY